MCAVTYICVRLHIKAGAAHRNHVQSRLQRWSEHFADCRIAKGKKNTGQDKLRADQHKQCAGLIPDNVPVYHQSAVESKDFFLVAHRLALRGQTGQMFAKAGHPDDIGEYGKVIEVRRAGRKRYSEGQIVAVESDLRVS